MEEDNKNIAQSEAGSDPSRTKVGFPQAERAKPKSSKKLVIIIFILLLLLGAGAWYLFVGSQSGLFETEEPATPTIFVPEETSTPVPTLAEPEREGVEIQALNGSGIPGLAADLQEELEELGYTGIVVGNASSQNQTKTTVVFDDAVTDAVKEEIESVLATIYEDVDVSDDSLSKYDIVITIGYPKGHKATIAPTSKPASTATPTAKPTGAAVTGAATSSPTP